MSLSCPCACGGCGCSACGYLVVMPESPESDLVFQNVNAIGVGVLDSATKPNINFRGVASASPALTVTLDNGNHVALFTLDVAAIVAAIPQATTSVSGIGETATDAEAIAKASILTFVTPSNLAALGASTTFAGFTEFATDGEAVAQAASNVALVPSNLSALVQGGFTASTFADAATRAGAQPKFAGSIGYQLDTEQPYVGNSLAGGDWNLILADTSATQVITSGLALDISATGASFTGGVLTFNALTGVVFDASSISFTNGQFLNLGTNVTQFAVDGGLIPQNSVLTTKAGAFASSALISTFISSANTQTGWAVTNPSVSRTLDVAAATLGDLRAVVGTLINDLKAIKLPAT